MSFPNKGGGAGKRNVAIAGDYTHRINKSTGALELWKGDDHIATQGPDGSWFQTSISTGVGSLHLGGENGTPPAHSISSVGSAVGFTAHLKGTAGAITRFPATQGLNQTLATEELPTFMQFGPLQVNYHPNGAHDQGPGANCLLDFQTWNSSHLCISSMMVTAGQTYTGPLLCKVTSVSTGSDYSVMTVNVNVKDGDALRFEYPTPFLLKAGESVRISATKDNGSPLQVRRGLVDTAVPWRSLRMRTFTEHRLAAQYIGDVKYCANQNDHAGWIRLDGRLVSSLTTTQQAEAAKIWPTMLNIPDARDRMLIGVGNTFGNLDQGGSLTIARSALPDVKLTFTDVLTGSNRQAHNHQINPPNTWTTQEGSHTHGGGTYATGPESGHTHLESSQTSVNAVWLDGGDDRTGVYSWPIMGNLNSGNSTGHTHGSITGNSGAGTNHQHQVDISEFTSGPNNQNHDHYVSGETTSMNGAVTQSRHLPPYLSFSTFVFLGL